MAFDYLTPYRRRSPTRRTGANAPALDLHGQMNRLFNELFPSDGDSGFYTRSGISAPAMDIHEDDEKVEITAELPGVKEDDINLIVENGILTLSGEKKSTRSDEEAGYTERSYGRFERRITLPADIDEAACSASFENGVLSIALPKRETKTSGRRIPLSGKHAPSTNKDADTDKNDEHSPAESGRQK